MGKIKQGILGALSGKVGSVVGSSWKGIHYLRAMPSSMTNPRTPGQQNTRKKMDLIVKFLRACITMIRIGFGGYAVRKSAYNAATSYNLRNAFNGSYPSLELDFSRVLVSMGTLQQPVNAVAEALEPGKVNLSWDNNSTEAYAHENDVALVLIYNPSRGTSVQVTNGGTRSEGISVVNVPAEWQGEQVHCYLAFQDSLRNISTSGKDCISNSVYAGEVVIL